VTSGGNTLAAYAYNGDGARVKRTEGTITTYYIGNCSSDASRRGHQVLLFRRQAHCDEAVEQRDVFARRPSWLHQRHHGAANSAQTYYPYGAVRTTPAPTTDYTFTGQKIDASAGLMYYGARITTLILTAGLNPILLYQSV